MDLSVLWQIGHGCSIMHPKLLMNSHKLVVLGLKPSGKKTRSLYMWTHRLVTLHKSPWNDCAGISISSFSQHIILTVFPESQDMILCWRKSAHLRFDATREKESEQIMSCWSQLRILMHLGLQKHYFVLNVMNDLHHITHGLVGSFGPLLTFYYV